MHTGLQILIFTLLTFVGVAQAAPAQIQQFATPFRNSRVFMPNDGKAHAGIVVLHGSEGGSLPYYFLEAEFLAAHGYAVLAFCWYNCGKNPITSPMSALENIELRKTIDAIQWFKDSPYVHGNKIALVGTSRGGEQSLLLGSIPDAIALVDAIAVHTPSDTIVNGFNWGGADKRCWICSTPDVACFNDSSNYEDWDWQNMRWNPACGEQPKDYHLVNAWVLDQKPFVTESVIEIEKFKKPIFITVGDKDELWDYKKSVRVKERLEKFGENVELHVFPGEYHVFRPEKENVRYQLLLDFLSKTTY